MKSAIEQLLEMRHSDPAIEQLRQSALAEFERIKGKPRKRREVPKIGQPGWEKVYFKK